ncbi:MAG: chloride channel protein, partial [Deltaproteobacteria bacterium]
GAGAGAGTILFVWMISFCQSLFFGGGKEVLGSMRNAYVIVLPALGGLLVGPLVYFVAPEAKGHGVPEVLSAIAIKGGRIRPVVVVAKALGSAVTIGSGGSVGREGPIVQIGSSLGSTIGQWLRFPSRRIVNLVACGAAGGIAATFNTPIAGAMFALEVILADFTIQNFSTIVISAVSAVVVSRIALGDHPAFIVPAYTLRDPREFLFYLGLGVASGLGAILFMKLLYFIEDLFEGWSFPPYLKPAAGGLLMGLLGYFLPQVFGTGFDTITSTLNGELAFGLLLILIFAKVLATSLTLGSGASGGILAPSLFTGAVLGGAYGQMMHHFFPHIAAASGAYAMVGMAGVFAGVARAPITAILILFEMTQDYRIILPLMFATVLSTILAQVIEKESIYTMKLHRRGLDVQTRRDENLMRTILVKDAMTPPAELTTVPRTMPLNDLAQLFQESSSHGFAVVNGKGKLFGVVTLTDLERAMEQKQMNQTVEAICTTNVLTVFPDETLDDAFRHVGVLDVGRIPVVDRLDPRRLRGMLRRGDIVRSYSQALLKTQQQVQLASRLRLEHATGAQLIEIDLSLGDKAVGHYLREIPLSHTCVVASIQRGRRTIVPRGDTMVLAGDRLLILSHGCSRRDLQQVLKG